MIRQREGCDIEQEFGAAFTAPGRPLFAVTCSACSGGEHGCKVCHGSGEERVYRCAGAIIDSEASEVLRAYSAYESGHLPDSGSIEDQAAPFVELMHVVSAELGRIRADDMKDAERKAAQQSAKGRGKGGGRKVPNRV